MPLVTSGPRCFHDRNTGATGRIEWPGSNSVGIGSPGGREPAIEWRARVAGAGPSRRAGAGRARLAGRRAGLSGALRAFVGDAVQSLGAREAIELGRARRRPSV